MKILTAAAMMYVIVAPSWWPLYATVLAVAGLVYVLMAPGTD